MNFIAILAGAIVVGKKVAILGTPAGLSRAAGAATTFSYTLGSGANGLIVFCFDDNTQNFTGATWTATGQSAQTMVGTTERVSGTTRFRIFHLANPTPGATGAGVITLSPTSMAFPNGIIPVSIEGWNGTAVVNGRASSGAETNPAPFDLTSVIAGSLVLHGVCGSTSTVTIPLTTPETVLIEGAAGSSASLRWALGMQTSATGGTVTLDTGTLSSGVNIAEGAIALAPIAPKIYYVDASATGNDSANGLSPSTPWKTITKVNGSTFLPGDTILFAGGQTFTGTLSFTSSSWPSATPSNPVTIGSYGTGRATISSGAARGFRSANTAAFHLRDLNFVGTASPAGIDGVYIGNDLAGTGKLSYIRCTNLDISGYGRNGLSLYGGETSSTRVGFTDVILDGVVVHGNCTLDQASSAGIRVKGVYGYNVNGTPSHTNITLRNCVAYDNLGWAGASSGWTGTGIVLAQVQTALVEFCVAYNNGANNTNTSGPVGMFTYDSDQVTIQYCESYNNDSGSGTDGGGFDLDGGVTNSIIQYCYAHDNAGAGFMLFAYADTGVTTWSNNTVRYCISQNDAVGRTGWGAGGLIITKFNATMTNARAYNNTIYSNSTTAAVCYVGPQGTGGAITGTVANNIFYSSNGARLIDTETYNPTTSVAFKGNDYYAASTFTIRWNNVTYSGVAATAFANWKSAQGQETAPGSGLIVNPQLVNAGNGGTLNGYVVGQPAAYKLQIGSPMIGTGLNMSTQLSINPGTKDFFSTTIPVSTTFEIGAYEGPGV